jgi:hypothetical protein
MQQLQGDDVLARDGRIGALEDIYFDGASWQVRYLVVATGGLRSSRLLVSVACVAQALPARDRILTKLFCKQIEFGAGAWPIEAASHWLDRGRVCSGRSVIGFRIEAEDGAAGRLADLLVDEEEWSIDYLIIDVADAAGVRQILMPLDWVDAIDLQRSTVRVFRTREQLRNSPAV